MQEPVIILANGDFPTHPIPFGKLQDANTIICCDGAINILDKNGMEPHYILGDLDSIDNNLKNKYRNRIIESALASIRKGNYWHLNSFTVVTPTLRHLRILNKMRALCARQRF